jgi:hypothetical protein
VFCSISLHRLLGWSPLSSARAIVLVLGLSSFHGADALTPNLPQQSSAVTKSDAGDATTIIVNTPPAVHHRHKANPPTVPSNQSSTSIDLQWWPAPDKASTASSWWPKTLSDWIGLILKILPILGLLSVLLFLLWFMCGLFPKNPRHLGDKWIVWSIKDESEAGAAGAVIEALDVRANPLIAPFIQSDKSMAMEATARRQLLLAPPFLESPVFKDDLAFRGESMLSNIVWKDYLGSGYSLTFVEDIVFSNNKFRPNFRLNEAYEEVNLKFGSFEVRGMMGLLALRKRLRLRNCKNVLGFVSRSKTSGNGWSVRLNAQVPKSLTNTKPNLVASVWADTADTDYGDPLGLVAQRAAFKLITRIADDNRFEQQDEQYKAQRRLTPPKSKYDTNNIHAIANFRQGVDQLMQLL